MQFDPLNDAFTTIYNAEAAGKYEVTSKPSQQTTREHALNNVRPPDTLADSRKSRTAEAAPTRSP